MALLSLFIAWSSDPGAVPLGARPVTSMITRTNAISNGSDETLKESDSIERTEVELVKPLASRKIKFVDSEEGIHRRGIRRCHKCLDNYKPPRAHHDSVTDRCVVKMDHFCPWVGNVIGILNHKFFILFIFYTFLAATVMAILIVKRFLQCFVMGIHNISSLGGDERQYSYESQRCDNRYSPWFLMLTFETVVFLSFTSCMLVEQLETIKSGQSKIARMKISQGIDVDQISNTSNEFNEIFGGNSHVVSLHWFLPTAVVFPDQARNIVMGYEWCSSWTEIFCEDDNVLEESLLRTQGSDNRANLHSNIERFDIECGDSDERHASTGIMMKKRQSSRIEVMDDKGVPIIT